MFNQETKKETKVIKAVRNLPDGGESWTDIGVAFVNKNNTLSLKFNLLPVDGNTRIVVMDRLPKQEGDKF